MQEILETSLLAAVAVLAAVLRIIGQRPKSGMTKKQKVMLWRILAASLVLLALQALGAAAFGRLGPRRAVGAAGLLSGGTTPSIGHDILKKAFRGIRNGQVFDENFLMAVATIGALALAVYEDGDYLESIAVMLFYQVGEWFHPTRWAGPAGTSPTSWTSARTTPTSSRTADWSGWTRTRWRWAPSSWSSRERRSPSTGWSPRAALP